MLRINPEGEMGNHSMQVNLSASVSSSEPAANKLEHAEEGCASGFRTQMDQILNARRQDAADEESGQAASGNDSEAEFPASAAKKNESNPACFQESQSLTDSGTKGEDIDNSKSKISATGGTADFCVNPGLDRQLAAETPDQDIGSKKLDGEEVQIESCRFALTPTAIPDKPDEGGLPQKIGWDCAVQITGDAETEDAGGPSGGDSATELIIGLQFRSGTRTPVLQMKQAGLDSIVNSENEVVARSEVVSRSEEAISESLRALAMQAETKAPPDRGAVAHVGISETSGIQNSAARIEAADGSSTIAPAPLGKPEMGNRSLDRQSPASDSGSFFFWQNQPEISQLQSGKPHSLGKEKQQEFSLQILANPGRPGAVENPVIPVRSEMAAAQPSEFILQLGDRIQLQLRDGKGEIRIQLKPDSLGHLEIRAENAANGVVARIVAESSSVKNYLETNLHSLHQTLQDQGLKVERIQVSVQDSPGFGSSSGQTNQSGNPGPGNSRGFSRFSDPAGLLNIDKREEELAVDHLTRLTLNPNIRFHTVA